MDRSERFRAVLRALGLPGHSTRVAVVFDEKQPKPRVYYAGFVPDDAADRVLGEFEAMAVLSVDVTDDCEVMVVTPDRPKDEPRRIDEAG